MRLKMRPLFGKTISTLLCGLILIGQSAAWIHVATCDGDHGDGVSVAAVDSSPEADLGGQVHCCAHHHAHCETAAAQTAEPAGDERDHSSGGESHPHDSDRCAVCQSLFAASGVVASERPVPTGNLVEYRTWFGEVPAAASQCISLPHLRGPPIG